MAQGPDGGGFKVGHRASKSLYAEPATNDETASEGKPVADGTAADVAVAAKPAASEVDVTQAVVE